MFRGRFTFILPDKRIIPIWNTIVDEGADAFLKMMLKADTSIVAGGANFYLGLCDKAPDKSDTLADITGEPTVAFGYARKAIERNATGFPTFDTVNGVPRGLSKTVTFTAAGGNFDSAFRQAFLTSASSGTVGTLFAYSGLLPDTVQLDDGDSLSVKYELFLG